MPRLFTAIVAMGAFASSAAAGSHLWEFSEVYSNADGSIQFIELHVPVNAGGETFVGGKSITSLSTGNSFTFPNNLNGNTAFKYLLLATPDFAALPGAPAPDFTIPAGFLNANGDTLKYHVYDTWTFGALPELLEVRVAGREVIGFPALHDDGDSVSLRPHDTPEEAARVHRRGLARLFALNLKDQVRAVERLPGLRELALQYMSFGTEAELKARLVEATLSRCCLLEPLPTDADAFARRCAEAKSRVSLIAQEFMRLTGQLLVEHAALQKRLSGLKTFPEVVADLQAQLGALLPKDFLVAFEWDKLAHFPRYLKGASVRLDKLRNNPARDAQSMSEWKQLAQAWERERLARRRAGVEDPALEEFRWLLEELRVGLYAQELRTPMPVSVKRLQKIWESRPR